MGLTVDVVDAERRRIAEQVGGDTESVRRLLPEYDDTTFPLLRLVDPYGDTYFSSLQARELLVEWDRLEPRAAFELDRRAWASVQELIEAVAARPHTFVRFLGD